MPTEVNVTKVAPPQAPTRIAAEPPPPMDPVDPETAEVLKFIGIPMPVTQETPPPPEPTPEPTPAPAPAPTPTPAPPATPAAAPAPASEPPTPGSLSKLGEAADRLVAAADRLRGTSPAEPAAAPAPPAEPADEETALRRQALELLQSTDRKYRGRQLVAEFDDFMRSLDKYKARWEAEHPGEEFDYEADAHEEWRNRNGMDVADEDLIRAEARVEARRDFEERLAEERRQQAEREAAGRAEALAAEVPAKFLGRFDAETIESLKTKDPDLAYEVQATLPAAVAAARAVHELCRPGAAEDPRSDIHRNVLSLVTYYEDLLSRMPAEETIRDGQQFVPHATYVKLPPEQQRRTWTLRYAPGAVESLVLSKFKEIAEQRTQARKAWIAPPAPAAPAPPAPPVPTPPAPVPPTPVPAQVRPPAASAGPAASPIAPPAAERGTDYFFGRD